ncbi:hypothetical protein [uncultured Duncaniella sp.]|uniref:hypothetical protein n=1 Tax=uncultured Duncaniella sp. TaxID=2768039 RepID=UPI0025B12FB9|nr:hypothetical protein [uncultured Duncaniella sp.]
MEESELLHEFLSHGNGYYPQDKERFLRWAIAACRNRSEFPMSKMEGALTPDAIRYYRTAYEFVGLTLDAIESQS